MSRFPPIPPSELSEDQKKVHDTLLEGANTSFARKGFIFQQKDGALVGPFAPLMHTPASVALNFYGMVTSLAEIPGFSPAARETAILVTGALYRCKYEVYAHVGIAETTGALSKKQADRLGAGLPPAFEDGDEENKEEIQTAYDVTVALINDRGPLKEEMWSRAVTVFGKQGAAALVHYVGAYLYTCMILNGFDVPVPSKDD